MGQELFLACFVLFRKDTAFESGTSTAAWFMTIAKRGKGETQE